MKYIFYLILYFPFQIIVLWTAEKEPPPTHQWPFVGGRTQVPIKVLHRPGARISERFRIPPEMLRTSEAIFSLDDDAAITSEEMDFAFQVWSQFPDRLVGFPSRSHYWDDRKHKWVYTSKWANDFSMILTGAAFYHKYYNSLYAQVLSPALHQVVDEAGNCEDILMNFLVSHVTRRPPIKVTQRKQYKESAPSGLRYLKFLEQAKVILYKFRRAISFSVVHKLHIWAGINLNFPRIEKS